MYKTTFLLTLMTTAIIGFVYAQTGDRAKSIARGKEAYTSFCMNCHMENGAGQPNVYPPLAKADVLLKQPKKVIGMILNGQTGDMVVNGKKYNVDMPAQNYLTDEQIADVINYVTNTWGNKTKVTITPAMVKAERK